MVHASFVKFHGLHAARTPVSGVGGLRLKGADDHRLDPGILDGARRPRSRLVPKTFKPMLGEAPTPLANSVGINSEAGRHDLALLAFSTGQDDPSPQRQGLRRAPARRQRRQLSAFHLIEPQRGKASTHNRSSPKSRESAMIESIWSPPNFRFRTLALSAPNHSGAVPLRPALNDRVVRRRYQFIDQSR